MADTLITPLNDSFVDLDVLGTVDPETFASPAPAIMLAWWKRRGAGDACAICGVTDWIVLRNRLSTLGSRNKRLVGESIQHLSQRLNSAASTAWPNG